MQKFLQSYERKTKARILMRISDTHFGHSYYIFIGRSSSVSTLLLLRLALMCGVESIVKNISVSWDMYLSKRKRHSILFYFIP